MSGTDTPEGHTGHSVWCVCVWLICLGVQLWAVCVCVWGWCGVCGCWCDHVVCVCVCVCVCVFVIMLYVCVGVGVMISLVGWKSCCTLLCTEASFPGSQLC